MKKIHRPSLDILSIPYTIYFVNTKFKKIKIGSKWLYISIAESLLYKVG
jgi:hypothetical protein